MSNIITPLTNVDFAASLTELKSHLEARIVAIPGPSSWSDIYYLMVGAEELTVTKNTLAELNLSILNVLYVETQGGVEFYQGATPNSYIILSVEETEATLSAYSAPLNSARLPTHTNGYHAEDCTLLESHSLAEPLFTGHEIDGAELVLSFQIPESETFKSLVIFVNEDTLI